MQFDVEQLKIDTKTWLRRTAEAAETKTRETKDFGRFVFINENRDILPSHVITLAQSIYENGYSADNPIISYFEGGKEHIIDGQHRFLACKSIDKSFYFVSIAKEDAHRKTVERNAHSRNWNLPDFVHFYAESGNEHYKFLQQIVSDHSIPLTLAGEILCDKTVSRGRSRINDVLKNGKFLTSEESRARGIAAIESINAIRYFSHTYKEFQNERSFLRALYKIVTTDTYDESVMLERLPLMHTRVVKSVDSYSYLTIFNGIYNRSRRHAARINFITGEVGSMREKKNDL